MLLVRTFGRFHFCRRRALLNFWIKKKKHFMHYALSLLLKKVKLLNPIL